MRKLIVQVVFSVDVTDEELEKGDPPGEILEGMAANPHLITSALVRATGVADSGVRMFVAAEMAQ